MVSTRDPVSTARGPVSTTRGPVNTARGPVSTARGPVSFARGPVSTARGPVSTANQMILPFAGDKRSNVWTALTAIHVAFVREHNRIAAVLSRQLRSRSRYISEKELDEKVYQEARKIVGAELQVRESASVFC